MKYTLHQVVMHCLSRNFGFAKFCRLACREGYSFKQIRRYKDVYKRVQWRRRHVRWKQFCEKATN